MSGNPGSVPPPVPPPVAPPIVSSIQLVQNFQVYMKEISINKPLIFIGAINRAKKWLVDVQVYLMLNQAVYNNNEKRILFALFYQ